MRQSLPGRIVGTAVFPALLLSQQCPLQSRRRNLPLPSRLSGRSSKERRRREERKRRNIRCNNNHSDLCVRLYLVSGAVPTRDVRQGLRVPMPGIVKNGKWEEASSSAISLALAFYVYCYCCSLADATNCFSFFFFSVDSVSMARFATLPMDPALVPMDGPEMTAPSGPVPISSTAPAAPKSARALPTTLNCKSELPISI